MKKTILLILILSGFGSVFCQTNQPEVITSSGDFFKPNTSAPSLSWTMGECITETYTSTNNILTQGFQQGHYNAIAIDEISDKDFSIKVFPNPTSDFIYISIKYSSKESANCIIELYDLQGKKLYSTNNYQDEFQLDMITYPAGTYLLKVMTLGNIILQNFKIQKNK